MKAITLLILFLTPLASSSQESKFQCKINGRSPAVSLSGTNVKTFTAGGDNKEILARAANNKGHNLTKAEVEGLCKKAMDESDEFRDDFYDSLQSYIDDKRVKNLNIAYFDMKCSGNKRLHQVILDTTGNPGAVKDLYDEFSLPIKDPRGIVKSTVLDSLCVFFSSSKLLQRVGLPKGENCRILIEKDEDGKTTHPNMNQDWLKAVEFFLKKKAKRGCEIKNPKTCRCAKEENGRYFVCRN